MTRGSATYSTPASDITARAFANDSCQWASPSPPYSYVTTRTIPAYTIASVHWMHGLKLV